MPIQYRSTFNPESATPGGGAGNPAKYVTIGGQSYYVTYANVNELTDLRVLEKEMQFNRSLDATEKKSIVDALNIAAQLPSIGGAGTPSPADVAPAKDFGSFDDYFGVFTAGIKGSADAVANAGQNSLHDLKLGLSGVSLLVVGVLLYMMVKG